MVAKGTSSVTAKRGAKTPRKRTPKTPKIDWVSVREAYVQGVPQDDDSRIWPTQQELAETYGISHAAVSQHASKERWSEQRSEYQSNIAVAQRQARITDITKKSQDLDETALRMANLGAAIITRRLAEIAEDQHRNAQIRKDVLTQMDNGGMLDSSVLIPSIDAREVDSLSKAGIAFIQLGQKALGTDIVRHQISGDSESPVEVRHSVTAELERDNPDRLAGFLEVLDRTVGIENILQPALLQGGEDILDAELVDEPLPGDTP
jgi:predicted transcriptional regulator